MNLGVAMLALLLEPPAVTIEHEPSIVDGLEVRGGFTAVVIDREARRRSSRTFASLPLREPSGPRLTAEELRAVLADEHGLVVPPSAPHLVRLPLDGVLVTAWEVTLPLRLDGPHPSRQTRWYGARDGHELLRREHVVDARARVFTHNPRRTPVPIEVELTDLEGEHLRGPWHETLGCRGEPADTSWSWRGYGQCHPQRLARADAEGDFFVPLPGIDFDEHATVDDAYAELSLYWHAERFRSEMLARGWDASPCDHALLLANFSLLAPESTLGFIPFDNAIFTGACADEGPMVLMGQGERVDYAYDGDIVYHELGHGTVAATTPDGLWRARCHRWGCGPDAGTIGEAIADYHAIMLTDDPHIGEYVGESLAGFRNADNARTCPADLFGEVHRDSEIVSGALWSLRVQLGERFDAVVLGVLPGLPPDIGFEAYATALLELAAVSELFDDHELAVMEAELEARGLLGCERVVDVDAWPRALVLGPGAGGRPGPVQLRVPVPAAAERLRVRARLIGGSATLLSALVRDDGAPLELSATSPLRGDWDRQLEAVEVDEELVEFVWVDPPRADSVTLALINHSAHVDFEVGLLEVLADPAVDPPVGCALADPERLPCTWWVVVLLAGARRRRGASD